MFLRSIRLLSISMIAVGLSACGSFNQNDLLSDSAKKAECPPGCASTITAKPEQLMVQIDSGAYTLKVGADNRLDITGTCYSPYASSGIYLQISTGIPASTGNIKTTDYFDLNVGTANVVSCVNGRFSASVRLGSLTAPAGYYLTAMIRGSENGQAIDNPASGGTSYVQFTVTQ